MARVAIDTNILAYAEGVNLRPTDQPKVAASRRLMNALIDADDASLVIPLQALAELYRVLTGKGGWRGEDARAAVDALAAVAEARPTNEGVLSEGLQLATRHGFQIFDALIMAAAVEARCDLLLSEDMQDGFSWRGVVVSNPFGPAPDARISRLLAAS